MMRRLLISLVALVAAVPMTAEGWPSDYGGVMLQGFYWDGYADAQWSRT